MRDNAFRDFGNQIRSQIRWTRIEFALSN